MTEENKPNREQWMLGSQMSAAIMNLNAPFCDGGPAEGPNERWLAPIVEIIANQTSVFALEDVIPVLQASLERALEIQEFEEKLERDD